MESASKIMASAGPRRPAVESRPIQQLSPSDEDNIRTYLVVRINVLIDTSAPVAFQWR